jgi:hypothetical protein
MDITVSTWIALLMVSSAVAFVGLTYENFFRTSVNFLVGVAVESSYLTESRHL